jgi:hypothetical protein
MTAYRITIKNSAESANILNGLLKILVLVYIICASGYLIYKLSSLSLQSHWSWKEWAAIVINLIIIVYLALQLLKTSRDKFILVTEDYVKFRYHFPWANRLSWGKIKAIQFGYNTVRFITKSEIKHKFYFSKATEPEKVNLQEALKSVALKNNIEFFVPNNIE